MAAHLKIMQFVASDVAAHCLLRSWSQFLRERGARVSMVCDVAEYADSLREVCDELFHVPFRPDASALESLATALDVLYLVQRWNPGIVHTHCPTTRILAHFAATRASVPLVLHTYHTDEAPLSHRVLTLMGPRRAHHQVVASDSLKKSLGLSPRATIIPHPIRLEDYAELEDAAVLRTRLGIPRERRLVGSAGKMEDGSGCLELLESFAALRERLPEAHLLWIGEGPLRERLCDRARELGLEDRVTVVSGGSVPDHINALELFVRPGSSYGGAHFLVEALALGKPVVASLMDGAPEVVIDQASCLLVPPGEPELLAEKLLRLLEDPEYAGRLASEGRRLVQETLSEEQVNMRLYGLYRNLWAQRMRRLSARA